MRKRSGITDYRAHGLSRPPITEALATAEVFELGAGAGCPVHIVHCSIGRGYELCGGLSRARATPRRSRPAFII